MQVAKEVQEILNILIVLEFLSEKFCEGSEKRPLCILNIQTSKDVPSTICGYSTILCVKRERGVILLGRFWQIQSQRKGGHTPCQDFYGRQLHVM